MNYMPKVLEMLGVEIGEEFKIHKGSGRKYFFNEEYEIINEFEGVVKGNLILSLITGKDEIEKLPWKPKLEERYNYVTSNGYIEYTYWSNCTIDYYLFSGNNVFRTQEEITDEIKQRVLLKMKGKYEND